MGGCNTNRLDGVLAIVWWQHGASVGASNAADTDQSTSIGTEANDPSTTIDNKHRDSSQRSDGGRCGV
jgi:hypothetical protein